MDSYGIIDVKNVDLSKLKCSSVRMSKNKKTRYVIPTYNDPKADNGRLRIRCGGKLKAVFGLNIDPNEGYESISISLSFSDLGVDDAENGHILKLANQLDDWVRVEAKNKCKEWFGKHSISDELIDLQYKPLVRYSRDKMTKEILPYPPHIKVSLDNKFGSSQFDLSSTYVKKGREPSTKVELTRENCEEVIEKFDEILSVIELKSIWLSSIGFGCKIKFYQIKVFKKGQLDCGDQTGGASDDDEDLSDVEEISHDQKSPIVNRHESPEWAEETEDQNI